MNSRYFIVLGSVLFAFSFAGHGQQTPDTSFRQKAISNLIQYYHTAIGLQAHLYNGPQYDAYSRPFTEGHQFFETDRFENGSVFYDGLQYLNVPLKLDIIRDELVMLRPETGFNVNLIKEKVYSFSFAGHSFIHITTNRSDSALQAGFYDQLYSSPSIKFLAKRKKVVQETSETSGISIKVYERTNYFIVKNGTYYSIRNKKSFMSLLKDKRNEMQKFIKNNKLRFRGNLESDVLKSVRYYDQL